MRLLFEIFAQTLRTLWAHKLRSFLTMFGIAWGIGSLLLLVGLGEGFRTGQRKEFNELGENVMFIWGGRAPAVNGSFTSMRQYYLTYMDYQDIAAECPDVTIAVPAIQRNDIRAVSDFYQSSGQIIGVLPNFNVIRYMPVSDGRWLDDLDNSQKRRVIVLGDEARRLLFPGRPAIGSTILLNGVGFQVIGTLKRIGHGDETNQNLKNFVPYTTMHELFPPLNVGAIHDAISTIDYQPKTRELHDAAKLEVHKIIGRNHGFDYRSVDAFDEWDTVRTMDQIGKIFDVMDFFLGSVGLVTLALGAIGIHAGLGGRSDTRDRVAQGVGCDESQCSTSIFYRRSILDPAERRNRHGGCGGHYGCPVVVAIAPWLGHTQAGTRYRCFGDRFVGHCRNRCRVISGAKGRHVATGGGAPA